MATDKDSRKATKRQRRPLDRAQPVRGWQRIMRHQVATALYTDGGDPAIAAALDSIGTALQLQAIEGPPGSRNLARIALDAHPRKALASLLRSDFTPDDLVLPASLLSDLAADLADKLDAQPAKPAPRRDGGEQPGRRDGGRDGGRDRDPKARDFELWLQVTKIHCESETPGPGSDRLLLDGRATYNVTPPASDVDRALDGYAGTFEEGAPDDENTYKLFEVRVPEGRSSFTGFINPLESDGMSRGAARAIGYAVGGLLTAGVNAAYAAITASAPSAGLTAADAAQDLISDFTLPWLIGLIARWFGPEQFTIVEVDAETVRTGDQVTWSGTVASSSQSAVGPGTLTFTDVEIKQQEVDENDDGEVVLRFLRDGGVYKLDIALTLVAV